MSRPPVPLLDPLSVAYLAWCEHERIPPNTVARRRASLRSVGNAGTATREDIEGWWSARTGMAPASRSNDLANLRGFYKWAAVWEHRTDDPTIRITGPKVPNGVPKPVSRADLHKLLDTLPADLRRAVCLGAYAGLRVSEAADLGWGDIDLETRRARILGKGQKTRLVPLNPVLIDSLLPNTGGNVITGNAPMSGAVLQRRVNRAIRAAGVDATFHKLRHRYGTVGYQATRDLVALAKVMGHSSIVTTTNYADASDDVADEIAAAVVR